MTEQIGKVGARLRAGRKSSRRASGGIEPFHTLEVSLDDRGGDLLSLKEVRLVTIRAGLAASLEAMDAAGSSLRWARHLLPPRHTEPLAWSALVQLLDALDQRSSPPNAVLALGGLRLLSSVGYALELERCIVCGRVCPEGAPAFVDAARGGIVCRGCGGRGRLLDPRTRAVAARAQRAEPDGDNWLALAANLSKEQTDDLLAILSDAMAAHADLETR